LILSSVFANILALAIPKSAWKETTVSHFALGLYILAFSFGVVVISFGAITYRRLRVSFYGSFTLQFAGSTLILLGEGITMYDTVTGGALSPAVLGVLLALSMAGNGLLAWALPLFSLQLTSAPLTRRRTLVHAALALVLAAVGGLKEALPGAPTYVVDYLALFAVYGYGCFLLLRGFQRIEDRGLRRLTKRFLLLVAALAVPAAAELVLKYLPGVAEPVQQYPLVQIAYYLASIGLLLSYTARAPEEAAASGNCSLPVGFVQRYRISPRECEIISMMERGFSNRKLAEGLFISVQTVKNHVYHIYRKTGAENKVQLINLIRTFGS
jgi:DNA-binding CsgD family transcriptional regulator